MPTKHTFILHAVAQKKINRALHACGVYIDEPPMRSWEGVLTRCLSNGNAASRRKAVRAYRAIKKAEGV